MRPDSSKNHGHVVRQWCSSGATRPPAEESIPCPIKDGTSVCQFHDGCNLQPVRPAVVAAGLLKMSELKCAKKCLNKEAILATPGNGTLSPKKCAQIPGKKWGPHFGTRVFTFGFWQLEKLTTFLDSARRADNR